MSIRDLLEPEITNQKKYLQIYVNTIDANNLKVAGLNYPTTDGIDGNVLTTDGNGNLKFLPVTLSELLKQGPSGASGYSYIGGSIVNSNDTFTGGIGTTAYTIGDIVRVLKLLNLIDN